MTYHFTPQSGNQKTGRIPVSTSSGKTCPPTCPFRGNGCYADSVPLKIHWSQVTAGSRGDNWSVFLDKVRAIASGQLWRHNQAGDLPGIGNRIDPVKLNQLASASAQSRGFTYTHKPVVATAGVPSEVVRANLRAVRSAVRQGFTINLSGNSLDHADRLARTGLPVATVVPPGSPSSLTTPAGRRVIVCPAQRSDRTCADCGLCARSDRGFLIGFLPHGTGHKKVASICTK